MEIVYIPAGSFMMGSTEQEVEEAFARCDVYYGDCDRAWFEDQLPVHQVFLDAYWIDRTEVTNAMFAAFLTAEGNQEEGGTRWLNDEADSVQIHLLNGQWDPINAYEDHPVTHVSWYGARAYCDWARRRLLTEAEWERAARSGDRRMYPWGNSFPTCLLANFEDCVGDTNTIGTHPDGASPYGVQDVAGNVWEWVADRYQSDYYGDSPLENPAGPSTGGYRVLRGGSWDTSIYYFLSAYRVRNIPEDSDSGSGFRCAMDAD